MVIAEADDGLAACVTGFFRIRYEVVRVTHLDAALEEIGRASTDVLFADLDPGVPEQIARIEALRRRHPELTIVISYLARPDESWEHARLRESVDVMVRKPYRVSEVATLLREHPRSA